MSLLIKKNINTLYMPRFYDEKNIALNSFRKINEEVVRRRKTKYEEKPAPLVAKTPELFDNLRERLEAIDVGVSDLRETIKLSGAATSPSTVIDRFVSTASNLSGKISNTRDFVVRKLKRDMNSFSSEEVSEIGVMVKSLGVKLGDAVDTLQGRITNARGRNRLAIELFNQRALDVIQQFTSGLTELLQMLNDAVQSYKKSGGMYGGSKYPITTMPVERVRMNLFPRLDDMMSPRPVDSVNPVIPIRSIREIPDARFFRKIGGAELYSHEPVMKGGTAVAYRKGLQFGNPFTSLGQFPPRNTQDLTDLPRRFL